MQERTLMQLSLLSKIFGWVFFIPAAVLGYIVAYTIAFWATTFTLSIFTSVPELARITAACLGGAAFVLIGTAVAPLYRGFTAIALISLNAIVMTAYLVLYFQGEMGSRPLWEVLVDFFGGLFGAGGALFWVLNTLGWSKVTKVSSMWKENEQ